MLTIFAYEVHEAVGEAGDVGIQLPPSPSIQTLDAYEAKWATCLQPPGVMHSTLLLARRAGNKISEAFSPRKRSAPCVGQEKQSASQEPKRPRSEGEACFP